MDPPHPSHHHHRLHLHLHLDPGHHHRIHIHLCHHSTHLLLPAAPSAHHHQHQQQGALAPPQSFPAAHPYPPNAAGWHPQGPVTGLQGEAEAANGFWEEPALQAEQGEEVYFEEEDEEEEEPVFVLTDEWAEFFAKADAKRKLAKQQQRKNRKK